MQKLTSLLIAMGVVAAAPQTADALTLSPGTLRIDLAPIERGILDSGVIGGARGLTITTGGGFGTSLGLGAGVSYGVMEKLEVGGILLPLGLSGATGFGAIQLYGRYLLMTGQTSVGLQLALALPTSASGFGFGNAFGLGLGLPVDFALGDGMGLRTGVELEIITGTFGFLSLDVPLALSFGVAENIDAGVTSGILIGNFDAAGDTIVVPLGVFAAMVVENVGRFSVDFGFPAFITTGGGDTLNLDVIQIIFGYAMKMDVGGGGG